MSTSFHPWRKVGTNVCNFFVFFVGVSNDPEGYSGLEKHGNDRQSERYEELNKKQSTKAVDTSYEQVKTPHIKTISMDTGSEYEAVPMSGPLKQSSETWKFKSKSGKNDSSYEVPDNPHGTYVNSHMSSKARVWKSSPSSHFHWYFYNFLWMLMSNY